MAAELAPRDDVRAVLIGGSVGRREHVVSSDVDLLVVRTENSTLPTADRTVRDGLLVEYIARTEADWRARFDRPSTSWLYSFLEGEVVYDTGPAARLVTDGHTVLKTFTTSDEDRSMLAAHLWHGQARLDRAAESGEASQLGFWSSLLVELVIHALYAIHDVPRAPGTRQLANLHLVALTERELGLLDTMLTADVSGRFDATRELIAHLRTALGPPDLERL